MCRNGRSVIELLIRGERLSFPGESHLLIEPKGTLRTFFVDRPHPATVADLCQRCLARAEQLSNLQLVSTRRDRIAQERRVDVESVCGDVGEL